MSGRYAADTTVPVKRSRMELERLLERYGASRFAYAWEGQSYRVGFSMRNRTIRLSLEMPEPDAQEFTVTPTKRWKRSAGAAKDAYDQAVRSRWRALVLIIKAKLEGIELGITTFEEEFLSNLVLPSGETVGESIAPQLAQIMTGRVPIMLGAGVRA